MWNATKWRKPHAFSGQKAGPFWASLFCFSLSFPSPMNGYAHRARVWTASFFERNLVLTAPFSLLCRVQSAFGSRRLVIFRMLRAFLDGMGAQFFVLIRFLPYSADPGSRWGAINTLVPMVCLLALVASSFHACATGKMKNRPLTSISSGDADKRPALPCRKPCAERLLLPPLAGTSQQIGCLGGQGNCFMQL